MYTMFEANVYKQRREALIKNFREGIILMPANLQLPANFPKNPFKFRQDSTFLYYCGIDYPDVFLAIDIDNQQTIIFGDEQNLDDTIWTGPVETIRELADKSAINKVLPFAKLSDFLLKKKVHYIYPYQKELVIILSELLNFPIANLQENASELLTISTVKQRSIKEEIEINQIEDALNTASIPMHLLAMKNALAGKTEAEILSLMQQIVVKNNFEMAFLPICSVRGEILHNNTYNNTLQKGDLLLIDAGAENKMHYASDITRTTPVNGKFTTQQKEIYQIVLNAQLTCIESLKTGVMYRDIHFIAAKTISQGLIDLGLINTSADEAINLGLHTLFFPHGIGHMLGLDVHDMENLGEDYVGYDETIQRSTEFGTAFLRLAKKVEKNNIVTVEPGIYFIPELIQKWEADKIFTDKLNYNQLKKYLDFGGIRIEDTVLVNNTNASVLGKKLPKSIEEIETLFK